MAKIICEIPYKPRPDQEEVHAGLDNHRFSVIVAHRRMGKTVAVLNHLIKEACASTKESPRFAYIAPFRNQAESIAFDYLRHFTENIEDRIVNKQSLSVEFGHNGARIRLFGADNPDSLRGLYWDGVVLDEVAQMPPEVWGEIVRPALADRQGFAVFIGTPKGINLFSELYYSAVKADDWFSGFYPVTKTNVLPETEIDAARKSMTDAQFRQEFLCDFEASNDDVFIPFDLTLQAATRDLKPNGCPIIIGVDPARFGKDRSVIYIRKGLKTLLVKKYNGIDTMHLVGEVSQLARSYNPESICVDGVGLGAGVVDRLKQLNLPVVDVQSGENANDKEKYHNRRAELWGLMRDWLKDGDIPDDQELIADLTSPTYIFDSRNRIQLEKKETLKKRGLASPDCADALAMTFYQPNSMFEMIQKRNAWDGAEMG